MKNYLPILATLILTALAAALFQACTPRESGRSTGQGGKDAAGQTDRAAGQAESAEGQAELGTGQGENEAV
ncbi:MAG: hypothetical protein U5K31_03040 [Balneolaceae bacterium]|nr:hypothetical protein [Balneolaceae bacterium]